MPVGYGVIGNTEVSGTFVLGSSPGTPASLNIPQFLNFTLFWSSRHFLDFTQSCTTRNGPAERGLSHSRLKICSCLELCSCLKLCGVARGKASNPDPDAAADPDPDPARDARAQTWVRARAQAQRKIPARASEKCGAACARPSARFASTSPTAGANLKPWPEKPAPTTIGPERSRTNPESGVVV